MKIRQFALCLFLLGFVSPLWAQQIVVRNNCITQCADCSVGTNADMATVFELSETMPSSATYLWEFGDAGSPGNTSTNRTGSHQYCTPGDKIIKLTVTIPGAVPKNYIKNVKIGQLPYILLGKDKNDTTKTICDGQSVELKAFGSVGRPNYPIDVLWYPKGQTTDNIKVDTSGCYSVQIRDPLSGCTAEAKMQIKVCGERDPDANINKFTKVWAFGSGAAIKFAGGPDNPIADSSKINVPNGVAKMEDPTASNGLIFYTDGVSVFDKFNQPIDPAIKLNGDITNSQGVTIIPKTACKGCQSEYYVITLNKNAKGENLIYYSIVDMKMNKGQGGISIANQLLSPIPTTSRILATIGGQGFYWLVTQDAGTDVTRTFKVSNTGISSPVTSNSGSVISSAAGATGTTKISPQGTKTAITIPGPPKNQVDIYTYDVLSGRSTIDYSIDLGASPPTVYGVEFSSNDSVLYVSMQGDGISIPSKILQFDISTKDLVKIQASKAVIYDSLSVIGAIQIDPVFKSVIFVAFQGSSTLGKITRINGLISSTDSLLRATFTRNAVTLPAGTTSQLGLPPSIPSPVAPTSPPTIEGPTCEGTTFKFSISQKLCDPLNNDRIDWKVYQTTVDKFPNKDGVMVPADLSKLIFSGTGNSIRVDFPSTDTYVVTAAITNACVKGFLLDAQEFAIEVIKPFMLQTSFNRICKTDAVVRPTTIPTSTNLLYKWSTGANTLQIRVPNPGGKVDLTLADSKTGCSVKQSTEVNFVTTTYFVPKATFDICMDAPVPFPVKLQGKVADFTFEWRLNGSRISTSSQILVDKPGNYLVEMKDLDGCYLSTTIVVSDKCPPVVLTPTVFTPNGDGKNDTFLPVPKSSKRVKMVGVQIFNRWGELIFSTQGPEFSWDGRINGTRVPQESYAWIVQYESVDYPERGLLSDRGAVLVVY